MSDLPRDELLRRADEAIAMYGGPEVARVYFKFTCKNCGARCILHEPNLLYERGRCCGCHHETEITEGGFLLAIALVPRQSGAVH